MMPMKLASNFFSTQRLHQQMQTMSLPGTYQTYLLLVPPALAHDKIPPHPSPLGKDDHGGGHADGHGMNISLVDGLNGWQTALVTISAIGAVGFVGLVIPHITRMIAGPRHLVTIPLAFLGGCHFMVIADLVSRTLITHQVLPIGVVTALVGAPVFALILYRNREKS